MMRYLSWDEVKSLDKFLVEDNDDAVGIEIHTGLYDERAEDPYGKPETVKAYTLEELSGGDFLKLGTNLLRAVVCNRLYYTDGRNWVDNTKMNVAYIGARREGGYDYERAVLTFQDPVVILPDEEILALDRFMARDNKRVKALRIMPGFRGLGGTNTSGFSGDWERTRDYPVEILDGGEFLWAQGVSIRALIHDVLYFVRTDRNGKARVFTQNHRGNTTVLMGEGIAYDTVAATEVILLLK